MISWNSLPSLYNPVCKFTIIFSSCEDLWSHLNRSCDWAENQKASSTSSFSSPEACCWSRTVSYIMYPFISCIYAYIGCKYIFCKMIPVALFIFFGDLHNTVKKGWKYFFNWVENMFIIGQKFGLPKHRKNVDICVETSLRLT